VFDIRHAPDGGAKRDISGGPSWTKKATFFAVSRPKRPAAQKFNGLPDLAMGM
jgi:hypothetical protein